jgi:hypothetical protein
MTIEEVKVELSLLTARRERLGGEILALLNKGCLPLDEAKEKMKTLGMETEIREGVELVVFTTTEGKKGYTSFPLWYPLYATMDDVFAGLETDRAMIKDIKKRRSERLEYERAWGIRSKDDNAYIADHEKAFEKIEEYLANEARIEELSKVPEASGQRMGYTKYLAESGCLYPDEKRVIKSLDDTACALADYLNHGKENFLEKKVVIDWKFIQQTFLQENGEPYSETACRQAIGLAYANSGRKPRGPKRSPREPGPLSRRQ